MSEKEHVVRAIRAARRSAGSPAASSSESDLAETRADDALHSASRTADAENETPSAAGHDFGHDADHDAGQDAWVEHAEEDELIVASGNDRWIWAARILAILVLIGWTALFGWAMRDDLAAASSAPPAEWVGWIIDYSVPVLLIAVAWLIAMRNSTREANRFAVSAAALSGESSRLEQRLTVVNRELSLAREFLAAQSRELESLGRIAAERLSTHAGELQGLIADNSAQVSAIGEASETALANMKALRNDLPVVANSAKDVTNQIGSAGRAADAQLENLGSGFERLNEFGSASERQVGALTARIDETIDEFEARLGRIEQSLAGRFDALQDDATNYSASITAAEEQAVERMNKRIALLQSETRAVGTRLQEEEVAALEQLRGTRETWDSELRAILAEIEKLDTEAANASAMRIRELHEEAGRFDQQLKMRDIKFFEEMTRRQAEFETREAQASEVLAQRFAELDEMIAERRAAQVADTEQLIVHGAGIAEKVEQLSALIGRVDEFGKTTREGLREGMDRLGEQLKAKREEMDETHTKLGQLTEKGVRLLEIIQSGARSSREDLPAAIAQATDKLSQLEDRTSAVNAALVGAGQKGEDISAYLITANAEIEQADASLEALRSRLGDEAEEALAKLTGLRSGLAVLAHDSEEFAADTQERLRAAISSLEAAANEAFGTLDSGADRSVGALAERLGGEVEKAFEAVLTQESTDAIAHLQDSVKAASRAGRESTIQMRDQLSRVNDLTANLEQRIARARELAQEEVDNNFSRRMALITDGLNSAAIDIGSALSSEVSDTSWDAYLKGDRSIFTRRAVRLLDNAEAKEIADHYRDDTEFQRNVNRYIHDFEAMLRSMLSTRDGHAVSVTMLGSDMGKLYVALAQAIERFRN